MIVRINKLAAMMAIFATAATQAQDAGRIQAGSFDIIPTFDSSLSYIDNVTYSQDSEPQIDSWRATFAPQLTFATQIDNNPVQLSYRIVRGEYFTSTDDDYTDHFVLANGEFELNSRHRVNFSGEYEDGHEERGTGFSIGSGDEITSPDTFKRSFVGGEYSYGSFSSDGMVTLRAERTTRDYDRTEEEYLYRDRFQNELGAEFDYQIAPATNIVVDVSKRFVRYDLQESASASRDSDVWRILGGVEWESTAATTGFAKFGYTEREFESASRDTFTGTDWEVGVDWTPIEYTQFRFVTNADTRETNGDGDFIRNKDYSVIWEHEWRQDLRTNVSITSTDSDYVESVDGVEDRQDEAMVYDASVSYQVRRWLNISAYATFQDRDSNRDTIGYDRSIVGLRAEVTL